MRKNNQKSGLLPLVLSASLVLLLAACGSANANATPTMSVQEIFTAAIETFSAQQATQLALTPPTDTPAPTFFPTLPALTPLATFSFVSPTTSGGLAACDSSTYVADITIPDGTTIAPGGSFVKTWKLLNSGTCTWTTSYHLAFDSGDQMGGTASAVTVPVPPNSQTNISVNLVAPSAAGSYTGNWRMQNAGSQPFGNVITVVIKVGAGGTPAATSTAGTPTITITISGNVGQSNVKLTYTDGSEKTVKSNSKGDYSIVVPSGWSGTVTPSRAGSSFTPANRSYTNVTTDQAAQDYTASP